MCKTAFGTLTALDCAVAFACTLRHPSFVKLVTRISLISDYAGTQTFLIHFKGEKTCSCILSAQVTVAVGEVLAFVKRKHVHCSKEGKRTALLSFGLMSTTTPATSALNDLEPRRAKSMHGAKASFPEGCCLSSAPSASGYSFVLLLVLSAGQND